MKRQYSRLKSVALAALTAVFALSVRAAEKCTHCITFSAKDSFGIRMNKGKGKKSSYSDYSAAPAVNLEYSTDQLNWVPFAVDTDYPAVLDGGTYKFHVRGTNNTLFAAYNVQVVSANIFTNSAASAATAIACSGNVMTLLDYKKVAKDEMPTMEKYAFCNLFRGFAALTTAPALPAMTLAEYCYTYMFYSCSSLTAAPELPATTLTEGCYRYMFARCSSLTTAPALMAMKLAYQCYMSMFYRCTSLTAAPELPAAELANGCYENMFESCTSLTATPELPATTLVSECYWSMFKGCTSLRDIPALNVTSVTNSCCANMFQNCTNLVVNTTPPGREWKMPPFQIDGDAAQYTGKSYWASNMFDNTTGDVKKGAQIVSGKTYFVESAPYIDVGGGLRAYRTCEGAYTVNGYGALTDASVLKDEGVTNLVISAGVIGVGDGAFSNWKSLREVTVGADCESIGTNAFSKCYNLTKVTCEATNLSLGDYAFLRCNALQSLSFAAMPSNYDTAEMPFAFHAEINMRDGMPEVFAVPQITIGGYDQVLRGSTNLVDWVDVTTEKQRTENRFFKIVLRAK